MGWELLDSLTTEEAQIVLRNFLEVEEKAVREMVPAATRDGIKADFSIASIAPMLVWIAGQLKQVPIEPPSDIPDWIRKEHEKNCGWMEFDEPSKVLIFRAGYYLGEAFVRNLRGLAWGTGHPDYADKNRPVVTGFTAGMEMAATTIAENMMWRINRTKSDEHAKKAIAHWLSKAPGYADSR